MGSKDGEAAATGEGVINSEQQAFVLPPTRAKDPRSKAKYNLLSRLFFCWMGRLFRYGCRHNLEHSDLYVCPSEVESENLHRKFSKYWEKELVRKAKGQTPRLWMIIVKCFWWRFLLQGLNVATMTSLYVGQAIFLGRLTRYLNLPSDKRDDIETRDAYLFGTGVVVVALVVNLFHSHGILMGQVIGMMSRVMMMTAIYGKVLTLRQMTIGRTSIGHIINLSSNDVQRFDMAFVCVHYIWIAPFHLTVSNYLFYNELGPASFVITLLILMVICLQFFLARTFATLSFKAVKITDKRVRVMNEIIAGIRVIKMYAWENAFKKVVNLLRKHELEFINSSGIINNLSNSFNVSGVTPMIMGLTFLVFIGFGGQLTAQNVFTSLALFQVVHRISIVYTVRSFFQVYDVSVAMARIQKFLLIETELSFEEDMENLHDDIAEVGSTGNFKPESQCQPGGRSVMDKNPARHLKSYASYCNDDNSKSSLIKVTELSASWTSRDDNMALKGITFNLDHTAPHLSIVGPVGSGKSTLLQCLLGELELMGGTVTKSGRISYASQEPWVFSGSVRENIILSHPYQREWFERVVEACALDKDIKTYINGDLTLVGERGVTLSGGQKVRMNLARAVYRDADIYLLDDPLSAVDTVVGKHLFDRCLCGILKDKLVILVTHHIHFAFQTDQLLALIDGKMSIYGTCAELSKENVEFDQLTGLIKYKENDLDVHYSAAGGLNEDNDSNDAKEEVENDHLSCYSDYSMLSLSSDLATSRRENEEQCYATLDAEDKAQGSISTMTYLRYFAVGGNFILLLALLVFSIFVETAIVLTDWWVSDWAICFESRNYVNITTVDADYNIPQTCSLSRNTRLSIYGTLILASVLMNSLRGVLFYLIFSNASRVMHNKMFIAILRTPIFFFDNNPSGRILNRFSKDIGLIDDQIPLTMFIFILVILRCAASLTVAIAANPYIFIALPFVGITFLGIRWYYLKTSRDLKRLEALDRSPVYSHISTTLQGLATIRVLGQQEVAFQKFHYIINEHSKGWYLNLTASRWFGLRLDYLSDLILVSVVYFSIPIIAHTDIQINSVLLGLGLTYTLGLSRIIQFCIRHSAEVENLMVSTERIMAYCRLKPEASLETLPTQHKPSGSWPDRGMLIMEDVAFQYSSSLPLVLKHINFSVNPSEKIGIVGRTGAGKSSLISVLFRLAEPVGHIRIDGVDIKYIGLHDLRKKISIIPQDPVLFSGTIEYNLDPFNEYSDSDLWEVLDQAQLRGVVEQMEGQLKAEVAEGGSNFSVGQRQLMCLARALLRRNTILILDEATANVDLRTDEIIQQAIRDKFFGCTILTIAHRLNTIMDSDKILVLSNGLIREFASPYELLQNPKSLFFKMVEKTGPEASRNLHQMAVQAKLKVSSKFSIA